MKPRRALLTIALLTLTGWSGHGQIVFTAEDLPQVAGQYYRAYLNTIDVPISGIGAGGGPRHWSVNDPRWPDEIVKRMDIVASQDTPHHGDFPGSTYVERLTTEDTGAQSWSYYGIAPCRGRTFHGFHDTAANAEQPLKVFNPPTLDLPDPIRFGQRWSRTTQFSDLLDLGATVIPALAIFTADAHVDAYGTLELPQIGDVPTLRVNEVHTWEFYDEILGLPLLTYYTRNYYWLARGVGKALDIISQTEVSIPSNDFTTAAVFLRVFEASGPRDHGFPSVSDLRIRLREGNAELSWQHEPGASCYRVETRRDLDTSAWELRDVTTNNVWSASVTNGEPQMFFRVFVKQEIASPNPVP